MDRKNTLVSLLLLTSLIGASIVPTAGAQSTALSNGTNDDAKEFIQDEYNLANTHPFGNWRKSIETFKMYFHNDAPLTANGGVNGYYDYQSPVGAHTSLPLTYTTGETRPVFTFDLPVGDGSANEPEVNGQDINLLPDRAYRLYSATFDFHSNCTGDTVSGSGQALTEMRLTVVWQTKDNQGNWVTDGRDFGSASGRQDMVNGAVLDGDALPVLQTTHYSHTVNFGTPGLDNGLLFTAGAHRMHVEIEPADPGMQCEFQFDGENRAGGITMTLDSARINSWIDDRQGTPTTALPSAATTSAERRVFDLQVLHGTIWPDRAKYANPAHSTAPVNEMLHSYPGQHSIRLLNTANTDVYYQSSACTTNGGLKCISGNEDSTTEAVGDELSLTTYKMQYLRPSSATATDGLIDGPYQFEIFGTGFNVPSRAFSVGGKGFDLVADKPIHEINAGQATEYRVKVINRGLDADTYTASVTNAPNGWQVDFVNNRLAVAAGATGELVVKVTPPANVGSNSQAAIEVNVVSSFPNEVQPQKITLTTKITTSTTAAASLSGNPGVLEVSPGVPVTISGIRLLNDAPFAESYLLSGRTASNVQGWNVRFEPAGATIPADSTRDFTAIVTPSVNALDGQQVTVTLRATQVSGVNAIASLPIQFEVAYTPAATIDVVDGYREYTLDNDDGSVVRYAMPIRDSGASGCGIATVGCTPTTDKVWEDSAIFRVEVTNPTAVEETYDVLSQWRRSGTVLNGAGASAITDGTASSNSCGASADRGTGNPDFWRMDFSTDPSSNIDDSPGRDVNTNDARTSTSKINMGQITVPAFTTQYMYVELGRLGSPSGCPATSQAAAVPIVLRSVTDSQVFSNEIELGAYRVAAGNVKSNGEEFSNSKHAIHVEPERVDGKARFDKTEKGAVKGSNSFAPVEYLFRVTQHANEDQDLVVEVPAAPSGWSNKLEFVGKNADHVKGCTSSGSNNRQFVCDGGEAARGDLGPGDEIVMKLIVQPVNPNTKLGTSITSTVSVIDADKGSVFERISFKTTAIGQYDYQASVVKELRTGSPGTTISLPFVIQNTGSQGDTYNMVLTDGSSAWRPRFSGDQSIFLGGQSEQNGFLLVTVPQNAGQDTTQTFRIQVNAENAGKVSNLDFTAKVGAASPISIGVPEGTALRSDAVLANRGAANDVVVRAIGGSAQAGKDVTFSIDSSTLPRGWTASIAAPNTKFSSGTAPSAQVTVSVTPPSDALASSKVPLNVLANTAAASGSGDIILTLTNQAGVTVSRDTNDAQVVLAGGQVTYGVDVSNDGLNADTFDLTHSALPDGWQVALSTPQVNLASSQSDEVGVIVRAPSNVAPGTNMTFNLLATSKADGSVFDSLAISTVVGANGVSIEELGTATKAAPSETVDYVIAITNTGTLPDQVRIDVAAANEAHKKHLSLSVTPTQLELDVGESKSVTVSATVGTEPPKTAMNIAVTATSLLNAQSTPVTDTATAKLTVLEYVAADVDGDAILEYAVDRNGDRTDGFEAFVENPKDAATNSGTADLARFLNEAGKARYALPVVENGQTVTRVVFKVDGDSDRKVDHFVDTNGDSLPNVYWDPDRGHFHELSIQKDVNADGLIDYFIDTDNDNVVDKVYEVAGGRYLKVLPRDVDGDGSLDFAVDANGNGAIDADETVLFTRGGRLVTVLKVDVDGDGQLDDVFDTDGDGRVDSFIRAGETDARAISLRDVNGDGVLDWTYDSNLDGRPDAYYNPDSGEGGQKIDTAANFGQLVGTYWFVPVIFLLVAVLFIVLVVVTRR